MLYSEKSTPASLSQSFINQLLLIVEERRTMKSLIFITSIIIVVLWTGVVCAPKADTLVPTCDAIQCESIPQQQITAYHKRGRLNKSRWGGKRKNISDVLLYIHDYIWTCTTILFHTTPALQRADQMESSQKRIQEAIIMFH